ncbi:DUF2207 domain-containing protein [Microbacterium sp. LjRoot45]|uniref:DUF2207 domain-containing protein n=1 Tax=Microbacterium sp. LjRoot45 TaxID=3342329 RepID=UPI003ECDA31D
MRRVWRSLAVLALVWAASVGLAAPAAADVDDFSFDSMTVDYTLTRDDDGTSRLHVVEVLVARFPAFDQNRGIRRSIPDSYNGQPLHPRALSVTDEDGRARPMETDQEDGVFQIVSRSDEYLQGVQTFVVTYELENVTWDFPDTGLEFYWDVNGVDWAQPFGEVTARLHLDDELARAVTGRVACYEGRQDAATPCAGIDTDAGTGGAVVTARAEGLGPGETLTIAVGFSDGTFVPFDTSYLASPWGWLQGAAAVALVAPVLLAVRARRRGLADEPGRPTIIAEYTPPPNVDALESAVLLGKQSKAIPAEVLEQAVVGSIRIVEGERRWFGGPRLIAELVDPARADRDGRMLLEGLFPEGVPGEQYEFGRQDTRVSKVAQKILAAADRELTSRRLRRRVPFGTRAWPVVASVLVSLAVFLFGVGALTASVAPAVPVVVMVAAGLVLALVIVLIAKVPLTAAGAETRDHLAGLKLFIEWAEADRIRMLQSPAGAERVAVDVRDPRQMLRLYETLLPYAVVFGQEREWSAQLAVLYSATGVAGPYWYAGTGSFNASAFASGIGSLSAAASSSSSTSGGSGGGGGAGGGGGGGGGGGV